MKPSTIAAAALFWLAGTGIAFAQPGLPEQATAAEVEKLQGRRIEAMVRGDTTALGKLLCDDLTYVHSTARVDTKRSLMAAIGSGKLVYLALDRDSVRVRVHGDAAVVTGRGVIRARAGATELKIPIRFTDVYVRRDGAWQELAWQSTRVGAP